MGDESGDLGHDVVSGCCFGTTDWVEKTQGPSENVGFVVGGFGSTLQVFKAGVSRDVDLGSDGW